MAQHSKDEPRHMRAFAAHAPQQASARHMSRARWAMLAAIVGVGVVAVVLCLSGIGPLNGKLQESTGTSLAPSSLSSRNLASVNSEALQRRTIRNMLAQDINAKIRPSAAHATAEDVRLAANLPLTVGEPTAFASQVSELLQDEAISGCEPAALTCLLDSMGYDASLGEIIEKYLPYDSESEDAADYFFGDPYGQGGALPPAIVLAGNDYLTEHGSAYRLREATGSDMSSLGKWVSAGYPVLVWTTTYLSSPWFTDESIGDYEWYDNEHCMLLYGFEDGQALVDDPLVGLTAYDEAEFEEIYAECGSMCVVVVPNAS